MRFLPVILLFIGLSFTVQAQYKKDVAYKPQIYIGVNAGLNSYWGEGVPQYIIKNPLASLGPLFRLNMGYNISPYFGVRSFLGFVGHNWPNDPINNNSVLFFNAENLTVDFMVNLSNVFYYKQVRSFNLYLFGGAGAAFRNPAPLLPGSFLTPILRGGLQGDIALTKTLDLNVSGELNLVTDAFNGYPPTGFDGMPFDLYPALSVGLTYHFNAIGRCGFVTKRVR